MTLDDVKTLMETMAKTGLTSLNWESAGSSLHLERQLPAISQIVTEQSPLPAASYPAHAGQENSAASINDNTDQAAVESEEEIGTVIKSPVVGIYYAAPSPDSDPFITVGSKIEAGTTLCIIEAMKLMNEVTSSFDGEVLDILVENGQRVEFGQPLFRII